MDIIPNHIYKHYKQGRYLVLFVADDSTNSRPGNKLVVYVSFSHGGVHCRDVSDFEELVEWPDGEMRPRFVPE